MVFKKTVFCEVGCKKLCEFLMIVFFLRNILYFLVKMPSLVGTQLSVHVSYSAVNSGEIVDSAQQQSLTAVCVEPSAAAEVAHGPADPSCRR